MGSFKISNRESSNYLDGFYFTGEIGTKTIGVQLSDSETNNDLPIWIDFTDQATHGDLTAEVDAFVRNDLIPAGFKAARMENFGRSNEKRIDYTLDAPEQPMKYQYLDVLCAWRANNSLEAVAKFVYDALGVEKYERRESSNRINGCYFKGVTQNAEIKVQYSDEADCEELPYWIHVLDKGEDDERVRDFMHRLAKMALPAGFLLVEVENLGHPLDEKRIAIKF